MIGTEFVGIAILCMAFLLLSVAVWRREEGGLLAAVVAYVGIILFIVERQPQLLTMALTLPIPLALGGLYRFVGERARHPS